MHIQIQTFTVNKRFPLTISRGTTTHTTNIWVRIQHDGIEGWGEASPFSTSKQPQTPEAFSTSKQPQTPEVIVAKLQAVVPYLLPFSPFDQQAIAQTCRHHNLPSAAHAALDLALHDWLGKRVGLPLWQLWGLERSRIVPTSVTIGISSPAAARQRMLDWLQVTSVKAVKVKLGSPAGSAADQAMLLAVKEVAPADAKISIDANGGWNLEAAIALSHWLANQGVTYIEQPLPAGQEQDLPTLYRRSPLPIFVDESCFTSSDIPGLSDRVHGINIKLMKSGGLTEAVRMIHTAHAHGLQIMLGCYSNSILSNTAAAHLAPFANHLDLDSHLNLINDPFTGARMQNGCLIPNDLPGLGIELAS